MKEKMQTRVDESLFNKATIVGKMLGIESESDILRYALTEFIRNNLDKIREFSEIYKPTELRDWYWYNTEWGKYVRWRFTNEADVEVVIFEVFTDYTVNVQSVILPIKLSELVQKMNDSSYDITVNDEGLVLVDGTPVSKRESELEILQYYTIEYGKEIASKEFSTEKEVQSYADDFGIGHRIF